MANTFNKTVEEMGYKIDTQDKETILLKKEDESFVSLVMFEITKKELLGAIRAKKLMYSKKEINTVFNSLETDLKTFKQLSNYDIMN